MGDPVYITTTEAAKRLGMRPVSIRFAIQRGKLPAMRVGRDWLIDEREIAFYELAHRRERRGA